MARTESLKQMRVLQEKTHRSRQNWQVKDEQGGKQKLHVPACHMTGSACSEHEMSWL